MSENKKCCCGSGKEKSDKEKSDKEKGKYPVEPFPKIEKPTEKDEEAALKELNPSPDSMDDERG